MINNHIRKLWLSIAVPDWQLLVCKLEARISDDGWQMLLNRTQLGKSGVSLVFGFILLIIKITDKFNQCQLLFSPPTSFSVHVPDLEF